MTKMTEKDFKAMVKQAIEEMNSKSSTMMNSIHGEQWSRWQREEQESQRYLYALEQSYLYFCEWYSSIQAEKEQEKPLAASTKSVTAQVLDKIDGDINKALVQMIIEKMLPLSQNSSDEEDSMGYSADGYISSYIEYSMYDAPKGEFEVSLFYLPVGWFVWVECAQKNVVYLQQNKFSFHHEVYNLHFEDELFVLPDELKEKKKLIGFISVEHMSVFDESDWKISISCQFINTSIQIAFDSIKSLENVELPYSLE